MTSDPVASAPEPVQARAALYAVDSVEDLFALTPLARFETLIAGANFDGTLRAEPITFDPNHPVFGICCEVPGCTAHSTQAEWWCTRHSQSRRDALREGVSEADWLASATPLAPRHTSTGGRRPACRFCPDRDATARDLCETHETRFQYARRRPGFDEERWAAAQHALPGAGACLVTGCQRRAETTLQLCPSHRVAWVGARKPQGAAFATWLRGRVGYPGPNVVPLADVPRLVAAEIRYGLWAHTQTPSPARWHPMWLRRLVRSCREAEISSLTELDPTDGHWTPQPGAVNRILRELHKEIGPIHRTRADTRQAGYLDTNYWGIRFPHRRSPFDLTAIAQPWLREMAWDYLAAQLDAPTRPRTAGPFEQLRRSVACLSAYLAERTPAQGVDPALLSDATAKEFVADLRRCASEARPLRGVFNADGTPSTATERSASGTLSALRKAMRWALESGAATTIGLPREFIVAVPSGALPTVKNPRPFSDDVLRQLSDPANIRLLEEKDTGDVGLADIWWIQLRCGRRIGEVINLRYDCVGEHLARTYLWVDMTKVGKLDYAIHIPRDVYDRVRTRQAKTLARFRRRYGVAPTAAQQRTMALFPSPYTNPTFERSLTPARFTSIFKQWLESEQINLPGHTTHQARHTLATRLLEAGATMTHVKQVLGHVSEKMGDFYVLIAGAQVEAFLQQVWVTGPGNASPGDVVLTPTEAERHAANTLMIDMAVVPTEHGLCTYKPVVGGDDCPFGRNCDTCEHFVLTGADYTYWKRQEQRWAALAEGAPDDTTREYIYGAFTRSSQALAGLEKALHALNLLDQAKELDLRSPRQDFFDPVWTQGWRAGDLLEIADQEPPTDRSGARGVDPAP